MLLDQPDRESVISAFRCGARGVFSRRQDISEFIDCIEHVRKGGIWAGKLATNYLLEAFKSIPAPNVISSGASPALTKREAQVVRCAAEGKTNRTIANELGLSEHTIKNYLFRVFEKLGRYEPGRIAILFNYAGPRFRSGEPREQSGILGVGCRFVFLAGVPLSAFLKSWPLVKPVWSLKLSSASLGATAQKDCASICFDG